MIKILVFNGIYDVICAVSLIWFYDIFPFTLFSRLHITMYKDNEVIENKIIRRLLAYWIFTYGIIRIYAGLNEIGILGSLSYFIESLCFLIEDVIDNKVVKYKVYSVSTMCFIIGLFL